MPYALVTDVDELDGGRAAYGASTIPRASQVQDYLIRTAAELDAVLAARGYAVPVPSTATAAYDLLRQYNAYGGHAHAQHAAQNAPKRDDAWEMWRTALKMLGEIDVAALGATAAAEDGLRYNVEATAVFDMGALATQGVF